MTETVIRARALSKVYRLYRSPADRMLDAFGLLRGGRARYGERVAVDRIDLEVSRGEKVALIGRNGAGKSTLLRIVSGVVTPTSGSIEVAGVARALLQIGSGFHPDFTGRENALGYIAHLGVDPARAAELLAEIVEFAEIEEYIDQPLKTYSSGMAARLMFATSTAVTPDLLILDEVLSVGDAYFARKSHERIKAMCERRETTLLFVSHDVYSAAQLCERTVWLERGRVVMDDRSSEVVKAYEESIRMQEQRRLRHRKLDRLGAEAGARAESRAAIVEFATLDGRPLPATAHVSRIAIRADGAPAVGLAAADAPGGALDDARLSRENSNWGESELVVGRLAWPLLHYGTPFHTAACELMLRAGAADAGLTVEVDYRAPRGVALKVDLHDASGHRHLGVLEDTEGGWRTATFAVDGVVAGSPAPAPAPVAPTGVAGTARLWVSDVVIRDGTGAASHSLRHGEPMRVELTVEIRDRELRERGQVLIAFHRNGVEDVCRAIAREIEFDGAATRVGRVIMALPRLFLGQGRYTLTVLAVRENYYESELSDRFYTINPNVHCALNKVLEFDVVDAGRAAGGTGVMALADWSWRADVGADAALMSPGDVAARLPGWSVEWSGRPTVALERGGLVLRGWSPSAGVRFQGEVPADAAARGAWLEVAGAHLTGGINMRVTRDGEAPEWIAAPDGATRVALGGARRVEILFYADIDYAYRLDRLCLS